MAALQVYDNGKDQRTKQQSCEGKDLFERYARSHLLVAEELIPGRVGRLGRELGPHSFILLDIAVNRSCKLTCDSESSSLYQQIKFASCKK